MVSSKFDSLLPFGDPSASTEIRHPRIKKVSALTWADYAAVMLVAFVSALVFGTAFGLLVLRLG